MKRNFKLARGAMTFREPKDRFSPQHIHYRNARSCTSSKAIAKPWKPLVELSALPALCIPRTAPFIPTPSRGSSKA